MIHELRTYTILPGKKAQFLELAEREVPILERIGIKVIGVWTTVIGRGQEVTLLLAFESLADREKKWAILSSDPEGHKLVQSYEPLHQYEDNKILQPTAFSSLR